MEEWKVAIAIKAIKRLALPVIIGSLVLWLSAHGFSNWVPVVCDISTNLGILVTECKQ
jgi:hypothetical protein